MATGLRDEIKTMRGRRQEAGRALADRWLSLSPFRGQEQEGEEGEEGRRLRGFVGALTAGTVFLQSADCFLIERVKPSVCTGTIILALLLRSPSKTNMAAGKPGSRPRRAPGSFSLRSSCLQHDRGDANYLMQLAAPFAVSCRSSAGAPSGYSLFSL